MNKTVYTEKELLKQVSDGNEEAFTELFNQYYSVLGSHIYRITESFELAAEIVQDVFLKIWINRETLTSVERFRPYLFVVSRNHALNCLKKLRSERLKWEQFKNETQHHADHSESQDYDSLFDAAISQLPPQQQKVYLHSRHERMSYNEIARVMGISPETVKKYLQLASASISQHIRLHIEKEHMLYLLVIGVAIMHT